MFVWVWWTVFILPIGHSDFQGYQVICFCVTTYKHIFNYFWWGLLNKTYLCRICRWLSRWTCSVGDVFRWHQVNFQIICYCQLKLWLHSLFGETKALLKLSKVWKRLGLPWLIILFFSNEMLYWLLFCRFMFRCHPKSKDKRFHLVSVNDIVFNSLYVEFYQEFASTYLYTLTLVLCVLCDFLFFFPPIALAVLSILVIMRVMSLRGMLKARKGYLRYYLLNWTACRCCFFKCAFYDSSLLTHALCSGDMLMIIVSLTLYQIKLNRKFWCHALQNAYMLSR